MPNPILFEDDEELDDVDKEDVGEEIQRPFDPSLVRIGRQQITIYSLCERIKHGEINLKPKFQRFANIWTEEACSRLIESLLIKIPLPAFYVDATHEEEWQVIDGLQRMSVLKHFVVDKSMKLKKLEFLDKLEGCTFEQLHRKFQRRIYETNIILFAIEPGTPQDVKFNIFKRVNTGGKPLTAQEIRHAIFQGKSTILLERISNNQKYFNSPAAIKRYRMADRELILRYFTYLRLDPFNLKSEPLDKRLNETMDIWINNMSDASINILEQDFYDNLIVMQLLFGEMAFRKPGQKKIKRTPPINKPLFEAWMVSINKLDDDSKREILDKKHLLQELHADLEKDNDFMQSIFQGTGSPNNVKIRFEKIQAIIYQALNS